MLHTENERNEEDVYGLAQDCLSGGDRRSNRDFERCDKG